MSKFIKKCEDCGKDRIFKNKHSMICTKAKVCGSCAKKKIDISGDKNPFYGKKHSNETRKKMSDNHADITGDKNPFKKSLLIDGNLEKLKQRTKTFWENCSEDYRKEFGAKISRALCRTQTSTNKKHIHGHITCNNNKTFFYRSSWEKRILEYLNELYDDKKILDFSLEAYCIDYIYDGYKYSLRIDFEIIFLHKKVILECKPIGLRNIGRNPIKINAYKEYCEKNNIQFILFDNKDAKSINDFWNIIK